MQTQLYAPQRRYAERLKASGLCARCGRKPRVVGMQMCQGCREARSTDQRLRNQSNRKEQKCLQCSAPRPADRAYCDRCSAKKSGQAAGHGASIEDRTRLYEKQGGNCGICEKPLGGPLGKFVHVDHNHATKELRGLLCGNCNTGIGNLRDSVVLLERAIRYLKGGDEA